MYKRQGDEFSVGRSTSDSIYVAVGLSWFECCVTSTGGTGEKKKSAGVLFFRHAGKVVLEVEAAM